MDFLKEKGFDFPLARCLTLGCGAGDLERGLSKYNFCQRYDVYDIADGAIKRAEEQAKADGLSHIFYKVKDIDQISLPPDTYDVVFGVPSVHHFNKLEHIFSEVKKSLKPGGILFLNEFVGPA